MQAAVPIDLCPESGPSAGSIDGVRTRGGAVINGLTTDPVIGKQYGRRE